MRKEQSLIPELRFPEFRDDGKWDRLHGDELFAQISDKNHDGDLPILAITQEYGAIPRDQIDYNVSVSESSVKSYKIVRVGDFIISLRSFQGGIEYSDYEGLCSPAYVILREKLDTCTSFFKHLLKSKTFIREFTKNLEGLRDGKMISYKQFSDVLINLPSKPEQQKIADCLGSLDELIAAHSRKLTALQDHKKGLLQQLFPAEGETTPKIRFPEFENAGEWESLEIGEFGKVITGSTPATSNRKFYDGPRMFVSPADISGHQFIEKTNTTLTDLGFEKTRPIRAGSTLFVCIGSTIGKVAQNRVECATNQQINAVIPSKRFSDAFVFYCLLSHSKNIASFAGNQAVPIINKSLFSSIPVLVPELQEQQKIADCLSDLDALITAQTVQIAALKEHKKGLMQKLFPSETE